MDPPFFAELYSVYQALDDLRKQGQLFAPNSEGNFLWCPLKALLLSLPLCVVWLTGCWPVSPPNLLLGFLSPSFTHNMHTKSRNPVSLVPCKCRTGGRYMLSAAGRCLARPCSLPAAWLVSCWLSY